MNRAVRSILDDSPIGPDSRHNLSRRRVTGDEDPDLPDSTQNDAPDAPGVEHGSEENPDDR